MSAIRLSATSVREWLKCQTAWRLRNIAGLDPDRDEEALRIGGAWAKCHEAYEKKLAEDVDGIVPDEVLKFAGLIAANDTLDKLYNNIPPGTDAKVWEAEREMLRRSFTVYHDTYREQLQSISVEKRETFPLSNPLTDMPVPESQAVCVVKLDRLVQTPEGPAVFEMKSTSRDITPGSDYWQSLRLDVQVSFYAKYLQLLTGNLTPTIYDVWKRPLLRLKQNESVQEYADRVEEKLRAAPAESFQRHLIARTERDIETFDREMWNIFQQMKGVIAKDQYVSNTSQCISFMGKCPYHAICSRDGAERVVREQLVPIGFRKRDLTKVKA